MASSLYAESKYYNKKKKKKTKNVANFINQMSPAAAEY